MVNSVCLTKNYQEDNILLPSTDFYVISGADNIVHCVSLLDVCRNVENKYYEEKERKLQEQKTIIFIDKIYFLNIKIYIFFVIYPYSYYSFTLIDF